MSHFLAGVVGCAVLVAISALGLAALFGEIERYKEKKP